MDIETREIEDGRQSLFAGSGARTRMGMNTGRRESLRGRSVMGIIATS